MSEKALSGLILWDSSAEPPLSEGTVYRWNGYAEKDSVHSLLRYVETHGEGLRRKYLAWVHELGESRIDGERLIDHLAFEDGLSYWWMTLLVEKSPYKSPISDVIRLLALEEIVVQQSPGKLRLVSASQWLHETVRSLCQGLGIEFEWERRPAGRRSITVKEIYRNLPQPAQALVSLACHVWGRWSLRHAEKPSWFGGEKALFICSYFFNVAPDRARDGHFHSRYWEGLHGLMQNMGLTANWLQLYVPQDAVANPAAARDWIQRFNRNPHQEGFHAFLDAYLSWHVVLRVLKRWLWLNLMSCRLQKIKFAFRSQDSQLTLWPLMRKDWEASMRGPVAISNLLWIELFDAALRDLPYQTKGLYLCENQAWEKALIHTWRKYGHGRLIAVPHSTVRFWDLRYFADSRTLCSPDPHRLPQPDITALNGKAAIDAYLGVDYPRDAIVECEGLRYGHLTNMQKKRFSHKDSGGAFSILVLGDYLPSATEKLLQLLQATVPKMPLETIYTVKPHPSCPVRSGDFPALNLQVITEPLGSILRGFDVAYASNLTSAAVDAYLAGLPVVVMLDETELNFSPLRGLAGVRFVSTPDEVSEALHDAAQGVAVDSNCSEFFFLDPEFVRWHNLLHV